MHNTSRNILAMLLALLMTASALSGCMGSDDGPVEDDSPDELEDWNVYLVQSVSDLPSCDSTTDGRLYYVSMGSGVPSMLRRLMDLDRPHWTDGCCWRERRGWGRWSGRCSGATGSCRG